GDMNGIVPGRHGRRPRRARRPRGWCRGAVALLAMLAVFALAAPAATVGAASCALGTQFAPLVSALAVQVGTCLEPPRLDPSSGDLVQPTTRGLLVQRANDHVPVFTDGTTSWLVGPCGLQQRPNG